MTSKHINCNCSLFGLSPGLTTHSLVFAEVSLAFIIILKQLQFRRSAQKVRGCLFEVERLKVLSGGGLVGGGHLFKAGRLLTFSTFRVGTYLR